MHDAHCSPILLITFDNLMKSLGYYHARFLRTFFPLPYQCYRPVGSRNLKVLCNPHCCSVMITGQKQHLSTRGLRLLSSPAFPHPNLSIFNYQHNMQFASVILHFGVLFGVVLSAPTSTVPSHIPIRGWGPATGPDWKRIE